MKTYNDILIETRNILREHGFDNCSQEARYIVSKAAGKDLQSLLRSLQLYAAPQTESAVKEYIERRINGEPIAYILGEWEFYGIPVLVTPDVLIPRIDTELLIDKAKELMTGHKMDSRVLDLCCGSGCIACAIAKEMPATRIVAVDISSKALEVCRKNVALNRLNSRIICMHADATSSPPAAMGKYDMIISNPPYIASDEIPTLDVSVRDYEPLWALDGGIDGLKFYKAIIKYWKSLLNPGGYLLFEVGEGQAEAVKQMLLSGGFKSADSCKDTAGTDRVVFGEY